MKTAVLNFSKSEFRSQKSNSEFRILNSALINDIAASFQASIVDVLVRKTEWAIKKERIKRVTLTGGVASNSELRKKMKKMGKEKEVEIFIPSISLCTDNAAMIAAAGYHYLKTKNIAGLDLNPKACMPL